MGIYLLFLFVENDLRTHKENIFFIFFLLRFLNGFFLDVGVKNQKQNIANAERWSHAKPMVSSSSMTRNITFWFKLGSPVIRTENVRHAQDANVRDFA